MSFRLWLEENNPFPNSVVKQPVYHGTDEQFDQFDYKTGVRRILFSSFNVKANGFFFIESKEEAREFGKNIMTCYVNLTKPMFDPRTMPRLGVDHLPPEKEAQTAFILRNAIENGKIEVGVTSFGVDKVKQDTLVRSNKGSKASRMFDNDYSWIYRTIDTGGLMWDLLDMPKVVKSMTRFGYDGTFVSEPDTYIGRSIFVIRPDQIKIVSVERNR